ncbi:MAG: hypothetical protein K2N48_03310 [Muribaculaceae bacterium]|nr:hypothetical protein [Muribaculaceae bacterium]
MKSKQIVYTYIYVSCFIATSFSLLLVIEGCNTKNGQIEEYNTQQARDSTNNIVLHKSLLFLIYDGSPESPTQIIQCTDSIVKHGFAYVTYPYDHLETRDIIWMKKLDIDGTSYHLVEKSLDSYKISFVNKIIAEIDSISNKEDYIVKDDYQYIIYIDNFKTLIISPQALILKDIPHEYKEIINSILLICHPLYPNYGFINFVDP